MRLLLDTHVVIWYVDHPHRLSTVAFAAINDLANDRLISAATVWEIAIKYGSGKLTLSGPYHRWITQAFAALRADILPVTIDYADAQSRLPTHHGDPFDRLMIARSILDGMPIVSIDGAFDTYGVHRIW